MGARSVVGIDVRDLVSTSRSRARLLIAKLTNDRSSRKWLFDQEKPLPRRPRVRTK